VELPGVVGRRRAGQADRSVPGGCQQLREDVSDALRRPCDQRSAGSHDADFWRIGRTGSAADERGAKPE
jgi:hypothetical protein